MSTSSVSSNLVATAAADQAITIGEIRATQYNDGFPYVDFSTLPQETMHRLIQSIDFPSEKSAEIRTVDLSALPEMICRVEPSEFSGLDLHQVSREGWVVTSLATTIIENLYLDKGTKPLLKDREEPYAAGSWIYPCIQLDVRTTLHRSLSPLLKIKPEHRTKHSVPYEDRETQKTHQAIFEFSGGRPGGIFSVLAQFSPRTDNLYHYAGAATITIAFKSPLSDSMMGNIRRVLSGITTVVAASSSTTASATTAATAATTVATPPAATTAAAASSSNAATTATNAAAPDSRKRKLANG